MALFVGLLIFGPRPAAGQSLLRWQLAANQQLVLDFEQKTETFTELSGVRVAMTMEMRMQLNWTVHDVDAQGMARLTQSIGRLQLKMQPAAGETIDYDSQRQVQTSPAAREIAEGLAPLLNSTVTLTMSNRGQIRDVQLSDEAAETLEKLPKSSAFKRQLSREGLAQLLGQSAMVLPEQPVAPGATWSQSRTATANQAAVKVVSDYKFEGPHPDGGDRITVSTRLELPATPGGARLRIRQQQQTGELRFDTVAGRLVQSTIEQQLTTETAYRDRQIVAQATSTVQLSVTSK